MISIHGLTKRYGTNTVLDGIDLDIATGERVAIIGPSGTGKSTLLRCMNYLDRPDSGVIRIDDLTVDAATARPAQILALRRPQPLFSRTIRCSPTRPRGTTSPKR